MKITLEEYRKKIKGAFIGKTVGGTLGLPYEGHVGVHEINYYDPVPTTMLANDDLDLQVINLEILLHKGLPASRLNMGDIWLKHIVDSAPDEYGVALANHKLGLRAPISGIYRNKFVAGMGSAIRSELWACLVPNAPSLAATLAKEDASTDHSEDGIYAEMFLAALESKAFTESDILTLINTGLGYVDKNSKLYSALNDTINEYGKSGDVMKVRSFILEKYYSDNWTNVVINLSFILLALISCGGSFDKAVCTAVSLGHDADCTGATVGAIMGIINPDGISDKWTKPIGDALVLSENIVNAHCDDTINDFCETVMCVSSEVQKYYDSVTVDGLTNFKNIKMPAPFTKRYDLIYDWKIGEKESVIAHEPFTVILKYPDNIALIPLQKSIYELKLINTSDKSVVGKADIHIPYGFSCDKSDFSFKIGAGETTKISFSITAIKKNKRTQNNSVLFDFDINGIKFPLEAGIPLSREWHVKNETTGEVSYFENTSTFFDVPKGEFTYSIKINSTANKTASGSCGGTRPFVLKINGEEVYSGEGKFYVPTFHRDKTWTEVKLHSFLNDVEIYFPYHDKGEIFIGFSTTFGCSEWFDYMEYCSVEE